MIGYTIFELDNKLIQGLLPVVDRSGPLLRRCLDRQERHFQGRVVVREDLALPRGFSDHAVKRLDGIDRIDRLAERGRIVVQGDQVRPVVFPALRDLAVLLVPGLAEGF